MSCPNCGSENPRGMEMCPGCGYPLKPIPTPPNGKVCFGGYTWYVLERRGDRMLLITERIIEKRPYHGVEAPVTWETCDLRHYLNGAFFDSFEPGDREKIVEVVNENRDNPWYGTSGGNPTRDRVFLLSIEEVVRYFGDSGMLESKCKNPGFDWCKDEYFPWLSDQFDLNRRAVDETGCVRDWRLRSPGVNPASAARVMGFCGDEFDHGGIVIGCCDELVDGHYRRDGSGHLSDCPQDYTCQNGVRPALWIRI